MGFNSHAQIKTVMIVLFFSFSFLTLYVYAVNESIDETNETEEITSTGRKARV